MTAADNTPTHGTELETGLNMSKITAMRLPSSQAAQRWYHEKEVPPLHLAALMLLRMHPCQSMMVTCAAHSQLLF